MSYDAPFAGLKVVDLSQGIAGPYCAMLLAQHGAQVIKVENAGEGDWSRVLGARYGDHTAFSIVGNLGKRSVAIDLKAEQGKDVLWRLLRGADVFLEGFRPGVIGRLGLGYEAVSAREPRLLYLSISGFGQTGPLAERPAMDPVLQAFTGLTAENKGEDGIPHRVPVIPVDMATALYAYQALSSALYARRDEQRGRHIDVSLLQGAAGLQAIRMMASILEGGTVRPGGVPNSVYRTADGWMTITAIHDREWRDLCEALERPELAEDDRFSNPKSRYDNEAALDELLRPLLAARDSAEWSRRFTGARILHERVNGYADFLQEPQVSATGAVAWLDQPGLPRAVPVPQVPGTLPAANGTARSTSPTCGQHTRAVLREHGYDDAEIAALVARGVVSGD